MSDNDDEEEVEASSSSLLRFLFRNIPMVLAVGVLVWIYATRAMLPSHPVTKTDRIATVKPSVSASSTTPSVAAPSVIAETPASISPVVDSTPPVAPAISALPHASQAAESERIAHLESEISEQAKSIDTLTNQLAQFQTLEKQMQTEAAQSSHQLALFASFSLLKENVRSGAPFAASLTELYGLIRADEKNNTDIVAALDRLKPYADKGVPTSEHLQTQFNECLNNALMSPDPTSWKHNLQSLIRIRKVGDPKGNNDEAIIARAETKLANHDINGTLEELDSLSKPAAISMQAWVDAAHAYLDATSALDALQLAFASSPNA